MDDDIKTIERSNWLKGIVVLGALEVMCKLSYGNIIGASVDVFITNRLWQKNRFWRNVTAYIRIPLTCVWGVIYICQSNAEGAGMIFECVIYIILFVFSWNEFDRTKEYKKIDD